MNEPLLTLTDASVSIARQEILQGITMSIADREIVTLIGPNGAGKTTLVRTLLGLQPLSSGSLQRRAALRIGYMPQRVRINDHMPLRVIDFLMLDGSSKDQAYQALGESGVKELAGAQLNRVSGGELQRVLFSRALLRNPDLLVLDEPVQGVDLAGQADLYKLIAKVRDDHGCGVLMVSHDLNIVMAHTDTVICLNRHVCCQGNPDHVSSDPAFLELFGNRYADTLAVYHHHHDHEHDLHGAVVTESVTEPNG
ncbi:MAG: metal ABC transporter ATP-binding protein [Pseudomonadales bacterium]